jgi:hypothetical protein
MTAGTVGGELGSLPRLIGIPLVLGGELGHQVAGVAAATVEAGVTAWTGKILVVADMVEMMTIGDLTIDIDVGEDMGRPVFLLHGELAITGRLDYREGPGPAGVWTT